MKNIGRKAAVVLSVCVSFSTITDAILPQPCCVQAETVKEGRKAALKSYRNLFEKSNINIDGDKYSAGNASFAVVDINHDGIPELFMRDSGTQVTYQYKNHSVKILEKFAAEDMLQCFKKGNILRKGRMLQGYIYENIYRISKGKLKSVASVAYDDSGSSSNISVKGRKATEQQYDAYVGKISKKSEYYDVEYHNITSENLQKYLK